MTLMASLALLLGGGFGKQALCAPIDCKTPTVDNVEKAICASVELISSDGELAALFARRLSQCAPRQRSELRLSQKFWLRDRNACANALSDGEGAMERCVALRIGERTAQLNRIGNTCDVDAVAGEYRYVDTGYLSRTAALYMGRTVSVWGGIKLSSCDVHSASLSATLQSIPNDGGRFPVRFKAMPALQREWLCAKNPASHWKGTVRQDGPGFYLYLTDILGDPL